LTDKINKNSQDASISKLLKFYIDKSIDETQSFKTIRKKAYAIMPPETINQISCQLEKQINSYKEIFYWKSVDKLTPQDKPLLRVLFKNNTF